MKHFLVDISRWLVRLNPALSIGLIWAFVSFCYGLIYGLLSAAFGLPVYSDGQVHNFVISTVIRDGFFIFFPLLIIGIGLHYRSKNVLTNCILAGLLAIPILLVLSGDSWLVNDQLVDIPHTLIAAVICAGLLLLSLRVSMLGYRSVKEDLD
ncbi:MAG: hypothetical protein AAF413_01120 [Patescibacteria group bacterium]